MSDAKELDLDSIIGRLLEGKVHNKNDGLCVVHHSYKYSQQL